MRRRAAAVEQPSFFVDDADDSLCVSRDYFWMLRTGILKEHAREVWRSFRDGYAAMSAHLRVEKGNVPPPPTSTHGRPLRVGRS